MKFYWAPIYDFTPKPESEPFPQFDMVNILAHGLHTWPLGGEFDQIVTIYCQKTKMYSGSHYYYHACCGGVWWKYVMKS